MRIASTTIPPERSAGSWSAPVRAVRAAAALALAFVGVSSPAVAQEPESAAEVAPEPEVVNWRFKDADRPVKVIFLAGSVGAWPKDPYSSRLEGFCRNVEAKNLAKTGLGALALKQRFKKQVLENRRVPLGRGDDTSEYWLVFQGGLNSVAMPESTNHHIRDLYVLAHSKGIKVVGFTLTPWGDEGDRRRWAGTGGLIYRDFTLKLVDYTLGRLDPAEALGDYASKRKVEADAPWDPSELPDIAVDLYHAPYLRHAEAPLRELAPLRKALEKDKGWKKRLKDLSEDERSARLDEVAARAAEIPQWFMREELRSFDHIHPNADGHLRIASLACPKMPESWGCECPEVPAGMAAPDDTLSAVDQVLLPFYPSWVGQLLRLLTEG